MLAADIITQDVKCFYAIVSLYFIKNSFRIFDKNVSLMMLNVFMLLYQCISLRTNSGNLSHVLSKFKMQFIRSMILYQYIALRTHFQTFRALNTFSVAL